MIKDYDGVVDCKDVCTIDPYSSSNDIEGADFSYPTITILYPWKVFPVLKKMMDLFQSLLKMKDLNYILQ